MKARIARSARDDGAMARMSCAPNPQQRRRQPEQSVQATQSPPPQPNQQPPKQSRQQNPPLRPPPPSTRRLPRGKPRKESLLSLLGHEERAAVLGQCATRRYAKGEQIIREQEHDRDIYFIDRGEVRVALFSRDGREVSFTDLAPGQNFGEIALLDGKPRSATVIALTEADLTVMPLAVFRRMLRRHPAVSLELLRQLSAMIRRLCARVFEYSTSGVKQRIHAELLRLARANLDYDGVARIANAPTHAQLASRVSCHREAVSRELKALEHSGILVKGRGRYIIAEMGRLQERVEQGSGR